MKKIIAGIAALTIALSAFTGCTDKKNDKSTASKGAVTTAQENKEGKTSAESSCEDVIREFIQAYNDNDREKTFTMMYPDGSIDLLNVLLKTSEDDDYTIEDYINEAQYMIYDDNEPEKINFKRIISTEPLIPDEEYDIKREYGTIQCMVDYMNEHGGPDKVEPEKLEEYMAEQREEDVFEKTEITEGYYVLMELENENGDTDKGNAIVYRLNDGNLKVMITHSRTDQVRTTATQLYKAGNTVLLDMYESGDSDGIEDNQYYIVSSDKSLDLNVPDSFDPEIFKSGLDKYSDKANDSEWFMVINKDVVIYAVIKVPEISDITATYPEYSILTADGDGYKTEKDEAGKSFEELYDICKELISR